MYMEFQSTRYTRYIPKKFINNLYSIILMNKLFTILNGLLNGQSKLNFRKKNNYGHN